MRNYKGTSEQYVRDLVFSNNGYHLQKNVEFGTPKHFTPLVGDPRKNDTLLLIWAQKGRCEPFDGHRRLIYRRMQLSDLRTRPMAQLVLPFTSFTLYSILPQINLFYGTCFAESDLIDMTYTPNQAPFMMQAANYSLAWEGTVELPIGFDLALAITNPDLDGFSAAPLMQVSELNGFTVYAPS